MHTALTQKLEELAYRAGDGLDVSLLWDRETGRVSVSVHDWRSDEAFLASVPRERALDAFEHPFAYLARGGAG